MKTCFWILGWSLSILAVTGNGFIIFLVCGKRKLRTKTNAFIVSLAVADFCLGMSAVPSLFVCEMENGCKFLSTSLVIVWGARNLFAYASVTNLCCLVLDRYIAVVNPLKYMTFMKRRRVIQMVSLSWAVSFAFVTVVTIYKLLPEDHLILFHFSLCLVMITEFFPSVMLIFCFVSMLKVVFKHIRAARSLAKQLRFNHWVFFKTQEKSAIIMMGIVISPQKMMLNVARIFFYSFFFSREPWKRNDLLDWSYWERPGSIYQVCINFDCWSEAKSSNLIIPFTGHTLYVKKISSSILYCCVTSCICSERCWIWIRLWDFVIDV